ncbi:hypothetical protein [Bacteroides pyogenes]|uniref:hypothetical protein n=1 Tax=Bacteroides pyogenes TaxID=310300 RepID=UPI002A81978B|nr:hypothetical protein [Bacteroides pyogenes]MDY4250588.1 hypothetical protein [Bacteroides pyogenes]
MIQTFLTNLLLLFAILWLLLYTLYIYKLMKEREHKHLKRENKRTEEETPQTEKRLPQSYELIGKTKPMEMDRISRNISAFPSVSSNEKSVEKSDTFAVEKSHEERKTEEVIHREAETEPLSDADNDSELHIDYTMEQVDEREMLREELLLTDDPMPEVTPTAILHRDLQRLQHIATHDDEGEDEEVAEMIILMRGTELMAQYTACLEATAGDHQKVLALIRKTEEDTREEERMATNALGTSKEDETTADDRPLSYYL